jgi:hypothetical protein
MEARKPETLPAPARPLGLRQPPADHDNLDDLLATFKPVTLAKIDAASLLDRSEAKFLLPRRLLLPILAELRGAYRVFAAGAPGARPVRASRYRTLYFDTQDLALYLRHHAGAAERYKVCTREYVDSRLAFVEVKHRVGLRPDFEPGHYVFVVVDGRQPGYSDGMSLDQLAALFEELGTKVAYDLDGGKTSQMTFGGTLVNKPTEGGRTTSDIIYIGE